MKEMYAISQSMTAWICKGRQSFYPFPNLFNDFYAKDTSKKVRAIKKAQGMAGEHLTKPPYGYKVDPNDRKKWIVDEEAAAVVKRIFDLCRCRKRTYANSENFES